MYWKLMIAYILIFKRTIIFLLTAFLIIPKFIGFSLGVDSIYFGVAVALFVMFLTIDFQLLLENKRRRDYLYDLIDEISNVRKNKNDMINAVKKGFPTWSIQEIDYKFYHKNLSDRIFYMSTEDLLDNFLMQVGI